MAQSLGGQVDAFMRVLCAFEPGEYSGEDCAELVRTCSRAEKALAAARTLAAARAAACNEHRKEGFAEPSEWLARLVGTTARDAKEHLHTVEQLEGVPETRAALAVGQVSLGQAAEIARTEAEVPGSEADLLSLAMQSGLSKVRDQARKQRVHAIPAEELHGRQRAVRSVRHWHDDLDAVIVCDLRAYRRGHTHDDEQCHIVGGGPVPVRIAREMASDAFLKAVIHDGVNIHTVEHFGRHIPAELRTALELGGLPDLDGAVCAEEGCDRSLRPRMGPRQPRRQRRRDQLREPSSQMRPPPRRQDRSRPQEPANTEAERSQPDRRPSHEVRGGDRAMTLDTGS